MNINPLTQIDVRVILIVMVIVTLTFFGLRRFFVAPYLAVMLERDRLLDEARASDEQGQALLADADADAARLKEEARIAARELVSEAQSRADEYHATVLARAAEDASHRLEAGRGKIAQRRHAESAAIREHAIECVGIACARLSVPVDERAAAQAVDEVLTRVAS